MRRLRTPDHAKPQYRQLFRASTGTSERPSRHLRTVRACERWSGASRLIAICQRSATRIYDGESLPGEVVNGQSHCKPRLCSLPALADRPVQLIGAPLMGSAPQAAASEFLGPDFARGLIALISRGGRDCLRQLHNVGGQLIRRQLRPGRCEAAQFVHIRRVGITLGGES